MSILKMETALVDNCIALISQYRVPHVLSLATTILACAAILYLAITGLMSPVWLVALTIVMLLGLAEMIATIRIRLDIALLQGLITQNKHIDDSLAKLDESLKGLKLLAPGKAGRSLQTRLLGCIRIFKTEIVLCIAQVWVVLGAASYSLFLKL